MQFIMSHGYSAFGGSACQSNDVLGSDVGGKDGGADHKPGDMSAGQKVISRISLLLLKNPPSDAEQNGKIDPNKYPIKRF